MARAPAGRASHFHRKALRTSAGPSTLVQTSVKHTESCVKPEVEVRIRVRLALRMQKAAKQHQKGLIRLHVSCILGHMAFHLGMAV